MSALSIDLDEAANLTRTGDIWIFRGRTVADRAIQMTTNSPVNHVGMAVVLDDLPPLMWHAELGRSLPDLWSGGHQRGVQLHDLRDAVTVWGQRYGQRAWLRQLDRPVTREMEDAVLRCVARLDGTPFPSTARLASRWARGRIPDVRLPAAGHRWSDGLAAGAAGLRRLAGVRNQDGERLAAAGDPAAGDPAGGGPAGGGPDDRSGSADGRLETAYCAEVVAVTYQAMGLLPGGRRPNWYDPGRFWSGDELALTGGYRLGDELSVRVPAGAAGAARTARTEGTARTAAAPAGRGQARVPQGCSAWAHRMAAKARALREAGQVTERGE